jgi:hypothetical protein
MLRRLSISAALAALVAPVLLAAPAAADPGGAPDDPAAHAELRKQQPRESARKAEVSRRANRLRAEDQAPLSITIEQLTPSTIPDHGTIQISGYVTNDDTATWSTINVYAFISQEPLTKPDQLAEAAAAPADAVVGDRINPDSEQYKYLIPELAPGDSAPYTISIPRSQLHVSKPGVYWFGVHALGEGPDGRDKFADGRARTFLPLVPERRPGQEPVGVVIPVRHQLVYAPDGSVDRLADWTKSLSAGGRLRQLVEFGASAGDRTVTWVIDPAVVDAVRRIADGNPPRSLAPTLEPSQAEDGNEGDPGDEPSDSAAPSEEPTESPSADPESDSSSPLDLDSLDPVVRTAATAAQEWLARLTDAMRPEDQVMTLPYGDVDVAAAAAHDPELYQRAVARAGNTLPGFDVFTTPVISSPSGYLSGPGIEGADPASTILLTDAMFAAPAPALALTAGHQVVVTSTGAAAGGPGPNGRTSLVGMRQRLLSEAAVRFLRGGKAPLTMVIPHDWVPPDGSDAFFSGLDASWLDLTSVDRIAQAATLTPVDTTQLGYPKWQESAELPKPNFDAAEALIQSGVSLQNLLTLNNQVAGTVADQALGTTSYTARTRPIANRASADASRTWINLRLARVHIDAQRAVTLSGSSGRFRATITNELDQPVTVALDADAQGRLTIDGPDRVRVGANGRESVLLTARTQESGTHDVTLAVTDKRGTPLGASTRLTIRSAQVSNVIWLFLAGGLALLFGAIGVRLFRRVRNSRRTPADSSDPPGDAEPSEHREPAGAGSR